MTDRLSFEWFAQTLLLGTLVVSIAGCSILAPTDATATVETAGLTATAGKADTITLEVLLNATLTQEAATKTALANQVQDETKRNLGNVGVLALALCCILLLIAGGFASLILRPLGPTKRRSTDSINAEAENREAEIEEIETRLWQEGKGPNPNEKPPLSHDWDNRHH